MHFLSLFPSYMVFYTHIIRLAGGGGVSNSGPLPSPPCPEGYGFWAVLICKWAGIFTTLVSEVGSDHRISCLLVRNTGDTFCHCSLKRQKWYGTGWGKKTCFGLKTANSDKGFERRTEHPNQTLFQDVFPRWSIWRMSYRHPDDDTVSSVWSLFKLHWR